MIAQTMNPFIEHPAEHYDRHGGDQWVFTFPNGYGASVVRDDYNYGHAAGLCELAVLDQRGNLTYDTPITDDVLGWLTDDAVREHLRAIAELPAVSA